MSTPTPSSNANKQPLSYASHAVSTPGAHLNATTPRSSGMSPAIPRNSGGVVASSQGSAVKTPTPSGLAGKSGHMSGGAAQAGGLQGSHAATSTAMAPSLSQMSNLSNTSAGGGTAGLGITAGGLGGLLGTGVSPTAQNLLASFASPSGLGGVDMSTPALLESAGLAAGSHGVGGQPMNLTLSDLGLSSSGGRRNEDEERKIKLEGVLGKLAGRSSAALAPGQAKSVGMGRVSDEGVRRVGSMVGFDVEVEAKWEAKEFEGNRPVIIAGRNAVLIDLNFKNNTPKSIEVSFASENEAVTAHQADAARVLLDNLTPAHGAATINTKLDRFAANLEALSRLDKLSSSQLNCFEAMTGVYTSLQRLYEHEKEMAKALEDANSTSRKDDKIEIEVMCKKSGRPKMHSGRRVGLSLQYWKERRALTAPKEPVKTEEDTTMELGSSEAANKKEGDDHLHSLEITAEPNDPALYPSLRVSSDWLSDRVFKPTEETTDPTDLMTGKPSIDWLDPEPTYLDASTDNRADTMAFDNNISSTTRKLPAARFVARLWPPITMPWNVAGQILQNVGLTSMPTTAEQTGSYDAMLLQYRSPTDVNPSRGGPVTTCTRHQLIVDKDGKERQAEHSYSLHVAKQEYAFRLTEIPFAHPRQLVQVLPTLRQWACFGAVLRDAFDTVPSPLVGATDGIGQAVVANGRNTRIGNGNVSGSLDPANKNKSDAQISLSALLETSGHEAQERLAIDVTLSTSPTPTLTTLFPFTSPSAGPTVACVSVSVLGDGEIVVMSQNVVIDAEADGGEGGVKDEAEGAEGMEGVEGEGLQGTSGSAQRECERMARALDVCGDLGMWVEWIRGRYGRSG